MGAGATLIRVPRQRPYVKVASDGQDTIHVAFTNGHPRETATSLYYARYTAGEWYRADGRKLPDPPFTPADADRIYDGSRFHAWVHDVAFDADGHPRIVYAVFHSPTDHRYRHARWTGTKWEDRQLTPAGGFFVEDGAEQQYSGGIVFDHADPDVVYLSRPIDGQWEIERWHGPAGRTTAVTRPRARRTCARSSPAAAARRCGCAAPTQLPPLPHGDRAARPPFRRERMPVAARSKTARSCVSWNCWLAAEPRASNSNASWAGSIDGSSSPASWALGSRARGSRGTGACPR